MAATIPLPSRSPSINCVKRLAESSDLKYIPPNYVHSTNPTGIEVSDCDGSIPLVDFSALTSDDPDRRSKAIRELGNACEDWGFFMVVNHRIEETLKKAVIDACNEFFNLKEEEKKEFEGKHVFDPIRCGTSFNTAKEKSFYWRDFLKVIVHPEFHFPHKPAGFSEVSFEYIRRIRELARELLKGISVSLGLDKCYIEQNMNMESGLQIVVANLYPPCPQPDLALGMPSHSDHGILTLLTENEIGGLQLLRHGKWVNVNALPNSLLVNTGDQLEILSNGKYKSVLHRAVVNNKATRISVAIVNGPSLETIVSPSPELVDTDGRAPAFIPMKYKDYLEQQQSNQLDGKSTLDLLRVDGE